MIDRSNPTLYARDDRTRPMTNLEHPRFPARRHLAALGLELLPRGLARQLRHPEGAALPRQQGLPEIHVAVPPRVVQQGPPEAGALQEVRAKTCEEVGCPTRRV